MPRPDDGLIHAWLDGELDAEEAARVATLVADDPEWGAAAAEARGSIAASTRILGALDVVAGDVIPAGSSAMGRTRSRFSVRPWMRIAAGLALVVGTAYVAREELRGGPSGPEMVAKNAVEADRRAPAMGAVPTPSESAAPRTTALADSPSAAASQAGRGVGGDPASGVAVGVASDVAGGAVSGVVGGASSTQADEMKRANSAVASVAPVAPVAREDARVAAPSPVSPPSGRSAPPVRLRQSGAVVERALSDRALDVRGAREAPASEPATALVAKASADAPMTTLGGCWRTATSASADSMLVDPRVSRLAGDTLVIAITPSGGEASVVRFDSETLRGTARDRSGATVPFRAVRVSCPSRP